MRRLGRIRWITPLLALTVLGACADWNTGTVSSVIDAHVLRVVSQGTRTVGQPGIPGQPFQTVELVLDGGLYRGDHVTVEWGGRVALNANGLLSPGDRVLVSQRRGDNDTREYAIEDVVRLPSLAPFAVALVLALLVVARWQGLASLAGLGSGEAVFLAVGSAGRIDLHRLVVAGIVVGSLGALVDMGIGQASATFELAAAHDEMRGRRLYGSALNVGRDHIGSLVNTLALAYFGGAMPLIVLLSLGNLPLSLTANSETIVGSIIAVLVASVGLVLCVPITTAIAVLLADRRQPTL